MNNISSLVYPGTPQDQQFTTFCNLLIQKSFQVVADLRTGLPEHPDEVQKIEALVQLVEKVIRVYGCSFHRNVLNRGAFNFFLNNNIKTFPNFYPYIKALFPEIQMYHSVSYERRVLSILRGFGIELHSYQHFTASQATIELYAQIMVLRFPFLYPFLDSGNNEFKTTFVELMDEYQNRLATVIDEKILVAEFKLLCHGMARIFGSEAFIQLFFNNCPDLMLEKNSCLLNEAIHSLVDSDHELAKHIHRYGITDQKVLILIAQKIAELNSFGLSKVIGNFGIACEQERLKIVKIVDNTDPELFSNIHNYQLHTLLFEAVLFLSKKDYNSVPLHIQKFNFTEEQRIELLMLLAQTSPNFAMCCLNDFNVSDDFKKEAILLIAEQDDNEAPFHIDPLNFDTDFIYEVLIKCAKNSPKHTLDCLKSFSVFGLEKIKTIIFILAELDSNCSKIHSIVFKHYAFKKNDRLEILVAAVKGSPDTALFISEYNIPDEKKRIEACKVGMETYPESTTENFGKYNISDPSAVVELLKIGAKAPSETGAGVSKYIHNFNLKEADQIEIAKSEASKPDNMLYKYFSNYSIYDLSALTEILKLAAITTGHVDFFDPKVFKIKDKTILFSIFLYAFGKNQSLMIDLMRTICGNQQPGEFYFEFQKCHRHVMDERVDGHTVDPMLLKLGGICGLPIQKLIDSVNQIKDPYHQRIVRKWIFHFVGCCYSQSVSAQEYNFLLDNGFIQAVMKYTDPKKRYALTGAMITYVKNYQDTNVMAFENSYPFKKIRPHMKLPYLICASLAAQGVSLDQCGRIFQSIRFDAFKSGKNLRLFVNTFAYILEAKELSVTDKEFLLSRIPLQIQDMLPCLYAIQSILSLSAVSKLQKQNFENTTFDAILKESYMKLIPVEPSPNFAEKFPELLSKARIPNYIIIYASILTTLNSFVDQKNTLECLGNCVNAEIEGRFSEYRYDLTKNEHLNTVFLNRSELLDKWKSGFNAPLGSFLLETDSEFQAIDFNFTLIEEIKEGRFIDLQHVPFVIEFLTNGCIASPILSRIEDLIESGNYKPEQFPLLKIQHACISLTDTKLDLDMCKFYLKSICDNLSAITIPFQKNFHSKAVYLSSRAIEFVETRNRYDQYEIVDSDDFEDCFLAGSVEGSCQKVNGLPTQNKCLLAFAVDGKARLSFIRRKSDKEMMARQFLKILLADRDPVLFSETLYPFNALGVFKEALRRFAIFRAKETGLPLVTKTEEKKDMKTPFGKSLCSLSCAPAPFEYTDGFQGAEFGGGVTEGHYLLPEDLMELIWSP